MKKGNFTIIENELFNGLLLSDLTQREIKCVLLIVRLTKGCLNHKWAKLKNSDFTIVGVEPSHIKEILINLLAKNVIIKNDINKEYAINEEYFSTEKPEIIHLVKVIGNNLPRITYKNSNQELTKNVSEELPNMEEKTSQKGNTPTHELALPKDNIKDIIKNNDKDSIIGNNKDLKFLIKTELEAKAYELWNRVEPNNVNSFKFYLFAVNKVPYSNLYQFVSEIKQEGNIINPGAVFNKKVMTYIIGKKT